MRPLYQWKSFWLGVLMLVSLGWGWEASTQHLFVAHWGSPAGRWIARFENSSGFFRLEAGRLPVGINATSGFQIQNFTSLLSGPTWFPKHDPIHLYRPFGAYMLQVSHWLLMAVFFTLWGGLLIWRSTVERKGRHQIRKCLHPED